MVITSGETLNSSRGRDRLSSTPPGTHAPPEPRAGNTPAPGANSSRDKKKKKCPGASRDSRLRAPRPAPAARAASAPAPLGPGNSPSAQAAAKREAGVGPGQTQYGRAPQLLPRLPAAASGTPSREQAAAAAVAAAAAPHPTPPPCFLPSSPPRCHGNAAPRRLAPPLLPSRLPRPAQAPLPPASWAVAAPSGLSSRRVGEGGVRKGGAGSEGRVGTLGAGAGAGPSGREIVKPSPVPGRTYGRATEARRGC